jgi:hypothetical protein
MTQGIGNLIAFNFALLNVAMNSGALINLDPGTRKSAYFFYHGI